MDRIAEIAEHLRARGVAFAVIGAAAMSAHGFPRQTLDFDLLTTDQQVLTQEFWGGLSQAPEIRRGDVDDPLLGVVRVRDPEVDLVVGRRHWQAESVARAEVLSIANHRLPVVTIADLILLKLDAGGYRDAADIKMMLDAIPPADVAHIEAVLPRLDQHARRLWDEIRTAE